MSDRSSLRLFVLRVLVAALLATLFGRLWFLQVYEGDAYAEAAVSNRTRDVVTPATRGEIYDVQGRPLVQNRTALVVTLNRSLLAREPDDGAAVLERLGPVVGLTAQEISRRTTPCGSRYPDGSIARSADGCWTGSPYQPVPVAEYDAGDDASVRRVLSVLEHREDFPAVDAQFQAVRDYVGGARAGHMLGYLGPISQPELADPDYAGYLDTALVGRSGVEQVYDRALHGTDGVEQLVVDKDGNVTGTAASHEPVSGDRLVLSVDAEVQRVAEEALSTAVDTARNRRDRNSPRNYEADSGAVVVMEAKTGRIVAMASYPTFDPATTTDGISTEEAQALFDEKGPKPLIARTTQGQFAPASTFKVISTAAAVESGFYPLGGSFPCPGSYEPLGGKRNFEGAALGTISLRTAIVKSCDTVFYKFAYEQWLRDGGNSPVPAPSDDVFTMTRAFGLGSKTGIDLPAEAGGRVPDRDWKQRYWDDTKDATCATAGSSEPGSYVQRLSEDLCRDGFRMRGGDVANAAIGQGDMLVTPLQLATVYAAVANGGTIVTPTVAKALVSADGTRVTPVTGPSRGQVPVSAEVLAYLSEALGGVTQQGGTAASAFKEMALRVAAKTGTAEVSGKQDTSWTASFAPLEDPQLVVVGMISQGGTGGTTAAPMVAEIYRGIFGTDGQPGVLPGGVVPDALPQVLGDGTVASPVAP